MSISNIGGSLVKSESRNGITEQIWEIPAINESAATRKAKTAGSIKGLENIEILNVREIGSGRLPGRTIFRIDLEATR